MTDETEGPLASFPRWVLKVPLIRKKLGLGDLVEKATTAVGVRPCGGCGQRKRALNRLLGVEPRDS